MIKNDRQHGTPFVLYRETKANIEAIAGVEEGATAYATDSNEFGTFNGATWDWGQGGSGSGHTIQDNGTPMTHRANLNFTGDGMTVTDDSVNDATIVDFDLAKATNDAFAATSLSSNDEIPFWSSINNALRKITYANIQSTLKTYFDTLYVALTGNQSVGGIKTFTSFPVTPSSAPSTDYEVANKKYVDDNAGRETLAANRIYYVRTDGNDANDGLTNNSGGAFLTIQKAVDVVASIDPNGFTVTIQVANGTYAENVTLQNTLADLVTITGNTGSPSSVVTSQFLKSGPGTIWHIEGFRFTASSATRALLAEVGALITFASCDFGAGYTYQIESILGAGIRATGNYSISSGASAHISVRGNSTIRIQSVTVTLTGTPAFGTTGSFAFIEARYSSTTFINNNTFSGSATGRRHYVDLNAVVQSAGATLPGNAAGTTATGGIYA